jgi:hypothetical protein
MDRRDLHLADWDGDGACDSKCLGKGFRHNLRAIEGQLMVTVACQLSR